MFELQIVATFIMNQLNHSQSKYHSTKMCHAKRKSDGNMLLYLQKQTRQVKLMDKLELTGQNLSLVFSSRRCHMYGMNKPLISYQNGQT
jgi:hypothetical protein